MCYLNFQHITESSLFYGHSYKSESKHNNHRPNSMLTRANAGGISNALTNQLAGIDHDHLRVKLHRSQQTYASIIGTSVSSAVWKLVFQPTRRKTPQAKIFAILEIPTTAVSREKPSEFCGITRTSPQTYRDGLHHPQDGNVDLQRNRRHSVVLCRTTHSAANSGREGASPKSHTR